MSKPLKSLIKKAKLQLSPTVPRHMKKILSVEGQISAREAGLLYQLAAEVQDGVIVEVGSFRGRSAVALALGSKSGKNPPVYAIDPHETFTGTLGKSFGPQDRIAFFRNMLRCRVADTVRLINLPSQQVAQAWSKPIGFLWLDGDHAYDAVKQEFENWRKRIPKGALVAFHDSKDPQDGPSLVINEALESGAFKQVKKVDKTTVLQKVS